MGSVSTSGPWTVRLGSRVGNCWCAQGQPSFWDSAEQGHCLGLVLWRLRWDEQSEAATSLYHDFVIVWKVWPLWAQAAPQGPG